MKYLNKICILFTLLLSASLLADSFEPINDLDADKSVGLASNLTVLLDQADRNYKLVVEVENPYTNAITCSGNVRLVIFDRDGRPRTEEFKFNNLSVFPKKAFPQGSSYIVNLPKLYSELDVDLDQKRARLTCTGKHPHIFLPASFCKQNIRNHRKSCDMIEEFGDATYYPVFQNGVLLGNCSCE